MANVQLDAVGIAVQGMFRAEATRAKKRSLPEKLLQIIPAFLANRFPRELLEDPQAKHLRLLSDTYALCSAKENIPLDAKIRVDTNIWDSEGNIWTIAYPHPDGQSLENILSVFAKAAPDPEVRDEINNYLKSIKGESRDGKD